MTPERRVRVWLWLAQMASYEAEDIAHAWPPREGAEAEIEALLATARVLRKRARAIHGGSGLAFRQALDDAWRTFGSPAA